MWKHSHNELHHTYTNVLGKDNDLGYGIMRVDEDQRWMPFYLAQPLWNFVNACLFQYGIAAYDLEIGKYLKGVATRRSSAATAPRCWPRSASTSTRDYVLHPLLSGPSALTTLTANLTANVVRNLWTHSVIMCGHFPDGVQTFEKTSIDGETKAEWYLRQMLGSANISGRPLLHFMTGNLSFQIEHHLFPDLPSNRYQEIAPKVQDLFERYGLTYTTGSHAEAGGVSVEEGLPPLAAQRLRAQGHVGRSAGDVVPQDLRPRPGRRDRRVAPPGPPRDHVGQRPWP